MTKLMAALSGLALSLSAFAFIPSSASAAEIDADVSIRVAPPRVEVEPYVEVRPKHAQYGYRDYCVRQYFKCKRYSDNGPEFRACMRDRDCWDAYINYREDRGGYREHRGGRCENWRDVCRDRWGRGDEYYGCLRYHGCDD